MFLIGLSCYKLGVVVSLRKEGIVDTSVYEPTHKERNHNHLSLAKGLN